MLSIGKIAQGQHRYYERQVARGEDDYYSGRGEAPGEWTGAGARALGLAGRVSAEQFNALVAGLDPGDPGSRLRSTPGDPKVAAFDLTFSAPKSMSVLFAVAPASTSRALAACHEEAVRAALAAGAPDLAAELAGALQPRYPLEQHAMVTARALLAEHHGQHAEAAALFATAAGRWKRFEVPWEHAQALLGQGRCQLALGQPAEAREPLRTAREIFSSLGARPALAEVDRLLVQATAATA